MKLGTGKVCRIGLQSVYQQYPNDQILGVNYLRGSSDFLT